jgi:twinkle protein
MKSKPEWMLPIAEIADAAIFEILSPEQGVMLPDWPTFSRLFGGIRKREFTILCGSTGAGKTQFLANISAQLMRLKVKHLVMSVETGHTDYVKRVMGILAGKDMNNGERMDKDALNKIVARHLEHFSSDILNLSLYDNRVKVETLLENLTEAAEMGCKMAFIDNINFFMEVTSAQNSVIEMDRVIHEVVIWCKQHDMHVIMVMHPRKPESNSAGSGRVLHEFDIKGSSTAVQEAANVILLNRPRAKDVQSGAYAATDRQLTLQKMRKRGMYAHKTIKFSFNGVSYTDTGKVTNGLDRDDK